VFVDRCTLRLLGSHSLSLSSSSLLSLREVEIEYLPPSTVSREKDTKKTTTRDKKEKKKRGKKAQKTTGQLTELTDTLTPPPPPPPFLHLKRKDRAEVKKRSGVKMEGGVSVQLVTRFPPRRRGKVFHPPLRRPLGQSSHFTANDCFFKKTSRGR